MTASAASPATRATSWRAAAVFAVVYFVLTFRYGAAPSGPDIDESWSAVMSWAHLHGLHWGVDLVFTYGPLAYLRPNAPYTPALFTTFVWGQVLLGAGYAFLFAQGFARLDGWLRYAFAAVVLLAACTSSDALMIGAAVVAVVVVDHHVTGSRGSRLAWAALAVVALQINAVALMKFSVFPLAMALTGVGAFLFVRERRPGAAVAWLALSAAALLLHWLVAGQHLADLPAYLATSIESAAGYGAAMGHDATALALMLGIATGVVAAVTLALGWLGASAERGRALALCGYLAACLWLSWRASFTRADAWHVHFFFPLACFVLFALAALRLVPAGRSRLYGAAVALCLALTVAGTATWAGEQPQVAWNALSQMVPAGPGSAREGFEQVRLALRQRYDLPVLRSLIGEERVDFFGSAQGVVLVNEFNYAPRPVIQGYAAYTDTLRRLNEAYYLGAEAPAFVIADFSPIDGHLPTADDGLALVALLRNYKPLAVEKGLLLLGKVPEANAQRLPEPECPCSTIHRDDWIDVPGDGAPTLMHLRYELSWLGKLRAFFLHEPRLILEVQTANGEGTGYRLVRNIARGGFLVSPVFNDGTAYASWYFRKFRMPTTRVRVVAESPDQAAYFQPDMEAGFTPTAIPDEAERLQAQ